MLKEKFHNNYKRYRNLLSTLIKRSKQACYDIYFQTNLNNIKNIWKGIISFISLRTVVFSVTTMFSLGNGETNDYDIANTFNN